MGIKHQNNEIGQIGYLAEHGHVIIAPVFFRDRIKHSRTVNNRHVFQDRIFHLFQKEMRHKPFPEFLETAKGECLVIDQGGSGNFLGSFSDTAGSNYRKGVIGGRLTGTLDVLTEKLIDQSGFPGRVIADDKNNGFPFEDGFQVAEVKMIF